MGTVHCDPYLKSQCSGGRGRRLRSFGVILSYVNLASKQNPFRLGEWIAALSTCTLLAPHNFPIPAFDCTRGEEGSPFTETGVQWHSAQKTWFYHRHSSGYFTFPEHHFFPEIFSYLMYVQISDKKNRLKIPGFPGVQGKIFMPKITSPLTIENAAKPGPMPS